MAITYNNDFKGVWVDALSPLFQGDVFEILSATDVVLGTVAMPAVDLFNAAINGIATLKTPFDVEITTAGTATKFRAFISGTAYEQGTVGTSGADLNVASVNLNQGDKIRVQTWTLTFP